MNKLDNILQIITNPILKRAFLFLEEGNWEKANLYLEEVLNQNPEDGIAYLGKLMVDAQVHNCTEFLDLANPFENNINYQRCIRYADREIAKELSGYNGYIRERNNLVISESIYNDAVTLMNNAKTEVQFQEAANRFNEVSGYKDSTKLAAECLSKAKETVKIVAFRKAEGLFQTAITSQNYRDALNAFEAVAGYYDVQKQIDECNQRIEETIRAEEEQEREREKRNAQIDKILKKVFAVYVVMLLIGTSGYFVYDKIFKYSSLETAKVGDLVKFGNFEKNDIIWKVFDVQGTRKLLISKYAIVDNVLSTKGQSSSTWENSELCGVLNGAFYKESFSNDEKKMIKLTELYDAGNESNTVSNLVFLLSTDEVKKYLKDDLDIKCYCVGDESKYIDFWWTRTFYDRGTDGIYFDVVCNSGDIRTLNYVYGFLGIRPALWVDVKSKSDDYNLFLEKEKVRRDELERREQEKKIEEERLEQEKKRELEYQEEERKKREENERREREEKLRLAEQEKMRIEEERRKEEQKINKSDIERKQSVNISDKTIRAWFKEQKRLYPLGDKIMLTNHDMEELKKFATKKKKK